MSACAKSPRVSPASGEQPLGCLLVGGGESQLGQDGLDLDLQSTHQPIRLPKVALSCPALQLHGQPGRFVTLEVPHAPFEGVGHECHPFGIGRLHRSGQVGQLTGGYLQEDGGHLGHDRRGHFQGSGRRRRIV